MTKKPFFSQEDLEKINPLIKTMRERNEKMKTRDSIPDDPEQLVQVQHDINQAYDLLTVKDEILGNVHPGLAKRYLASLDKVKKERDDVLGAKTCQKAHQSLKQFKGKSKMTLGFLKIFNVDIDHSLFEKLTNHNFSRLLDGKKLKKEQSTPTHTEGQY